MKNIPDWELLACFLRAPDLVFAPEDRNWFRERWPRLVTLRQAARKRPPMAHARNSIAWSMRPGSAGASWSSARLAAASWAGG